MPESGQFVAFLEAYYLILKSVWEAFENMGDGSLKEVRKNIICYFDYML